MSPAEKKARREYRQAVRNTAAFINFAAYLVIGACGIVAVLLTITLPVQS